MKQGRVTINGEVCRELGSKIDPDQDSVEVDGRLIELPEDFTYILVHKPVGYVTTLDDPRGRPTVADLLDDDQPRLWPVGRLDLDSSGLLLMTDDGKLTHRLTHPSYEARKRYRVSVRGHVDDDSSALERLRNGVELDDGYVTEPADVHVVERRSASTLLDVTLTEGKNRQIRRMAEAIGHPVESLTRVAIGPIELGELEPGQSRPLTDEEIDSLYREVGDEPPRPTS